MWLHERLRIDGPDFSWRGRVRLSHGGDEYGNCSLSLKTRLFCIDLFPFPHFQLAVPVPGPGTHPWIDAVYWQGVEQQEPGGKQP